MMLKLEVCTIMCLILLGPRPFLSSKFIFDWFQFSGMDNIAFSDMGPVPSPPDSPNKTAESKTICSPMTSEDNHPDTTSKSGPFAFKYRYVCSFDVNIFFIKILLL